MSTLLRIGITVTALLLALPYPRADASPGEPPVRALSGARGLTLLTERAWLTAELSVPGSGEPPLLLGPSFPGARWVLEGLGDARRVQLAWVGPGGSGCTLSLPVEREDTLSPSEPSVEETP
jgi:hypothetical protein